MSSSLIDLSIIIVNYNGAGFLKDCLDTIFSSTVSFKYEVILLDNNSSDDSINLLTNYQDKIRLIENKANTGFSYANNQGVKASKGDYILLLNNDTILEKETLEKLWLLYPTLPKNSVVTPKLLNSDGSLQCPGSIWGQWRFWSKTLKKVPFIAGAAVFLPKTVYWDMNGLDEHLFFYNDDIDMCKALKKLNYPIYYYPDSALIHIGGLSTKFRKVPSLIEGYRGGIYLSKKHYGTIAHSFYRIILMLDITVNLIINGLLYPFSNHHKEFFKGYIEILKINIQNKVYLIRDKNGFPIRTVSRIKT